MSSVDILAPVGERQRRRRSFRLRMQKFVALNYAVDTAALLLFASAGSVSFSAPLAYAITAAGICSVFYALMHAGVSEEMADPLVDRFQRVLAWLVQLAFVWFYPQLAFFFLNVLFALFGFSFFQPRISARQLVVEWVVLLVGTGLVVHVLGPAIAAPIGTGIERLLVWGWYVVTLGRCAYLGWLGSRMRGRLQALNREYRALAGELESRVADRTRELEMRNGQLTEFVRQARSVARAVAHDLRQPVVTIGGNASFAARRLQGHALAEELQPRLARIQIAAQRMERVCDALSRLVAVSAEKLDVRDVDVPGLCERVWDDLQAKPGACARATLQSGAAQSVRGDARLLRLAMEELLDNAMKFTCAAAAPQISVDLRREPGWVHVCVADNGPGFDEHEVQQLFGRIDVHDPHAARFGPGLGLSIVDAVARRHGGNVFARRTEAGGALLGLSLPD